MDSKKFNTLQLLIMWLIVVFNWWPKYTIPLLIVEMYYSMLWWTTVFGLLDRRQVDGYSLDSNCNGLCNIDNGISVTLRHFLWTLRFSRNSVRDKSSLWRWKILHLVKIYIKYCHYDLRCYSIVAIIILACFLYLVHFPKRYTSNE